MLPIQHRLFDDSAARGPRPPERGPLDAPSEALLRAFRRARDAEGAHPRSVSRDISQLRALARASRDAGSPNRLGSLATDVGLLARVLREPPTPIARVTARARLIAAQRFIAFIRRGDGHDPSADLARLDALLPVRKTIGWHDAGTVVGGMSARVRRRAPTLEYADLLRLIDAAGAGKGRHAARDRALVALQCFSGLRADEVVRLRWEDLSLAGDGTHGHEVMARVQRDTILQWLPVVGPAVDAIRMLAAFQGGDPTGLVGPVIATHGNRPLGYRAARDVLRAACHGAALPIVETVDLRAAFAYWLRTRGLSDHEVAVVLGVARVRTVDRLLQRHMALDAQRRVRELLPR